MHRWMGKAAQKASAYIGNGRQAGLSLTLSLNLFLNLTLNLFLNLTLNPNLSPSRPIPEP